VELLLEDYRFFVTDPEFFCQRLLALTERRGQAQVGEWISLVRGQQTPTVVRSLLTEHYDPMYAQSIGRNFVQYSQAVPCELTSRSPEALAQAARWLMDHERLTADV
jgi:tRNA 2-selenouridine synthase